MNFKNNGCASVAMQFQTEMDTHTTDSLDYTCTQIHSFMRLSCRCRPPPTSHSRSHCNACRSVIMSVSCQTFLFCFVLFCFHSHLTPNSPQPTHILFPTNTFHPINMKLYTLASSFMVDSSIPWERHGYTQTQQNPQWISFRQSKSNAAAETLRDVGWCNFHRNNAVGEDDEACRQ
jgi:hypothetical protein